MIETMRISSIGSLKHGLGLIDNFTVYSAVLFLSNRDQVYDTYREYMGLVGRKTGQKLHSIGLDGAN